MIDVRAAYVVLTHRGWAQAWRLARAIVASSPNSHVVIAHDDRQERFPQNVADPRIEVFRHGLRSDWGSWELVEAQLRAFDLVRERFDPDLVCLISGQDYPVRPLPPWEAEAIAAEGWTGSCEPMSYTPRWGTRLGEGRDDMTRYLYRWVQTPAARLGWRYEGPGASSLRKMRDAITLRTEPLLSLRIVTRGRGVNYGLRRLRVPFDDQHPCCFGSQWIALRRQELAWLLDEDLAPRSPLRRLYATSIIPDESALVTPLSWRVAPSSLPPISHMEWIPALDRPRTYTLADLEEVAGSGSPFCRKVEPVESATLMDELDRITATDSRPSGFRRLV